MIIIQNLETFLIGIFFKSTKINRVYNTFKWKNIEHFMQEKTTHNTHKVLHLYKIFVVFPSKSVIHSVYVL